MSSIRTSRPAADPAHDQHLFIDNWHIRRMDGLARTLHPVKKQGAVLDPDMPWEYPRVLLHGSVIYDEDEKLFKMWYLGMYNILYAVSRDGLHWEKPELGAIVYELPEPGSVEPARRMVVRDDDAQKTALGTTANNIVLGSQPLAGDPTGLDSPTVVKDDNEPDPDKRYKLSTWINPIGQFMEEPTRNYLYRMEKAKPGAGHYLFYSPDGIHFTYSGHPPYLYVDHLVGDRSPVMYDYRKSKFVVSFKFGRHVPYAFHGHNARCRAYSESSDMISWTDPFLVLWPDEYDDPEMDLYSLTMFNYGDMYVGLLDVFYRHPEMQTLDTQLVCGHDGVHWDRAGGRRAFIPLGEEGTWDSANISTASSPPIEVDGELWFYYGGRPWRHGESFRDDTKPKPTDTLGHIGLGTLRKDGFVSLDVGDREGVLLTKETEITAPALHINANVKGNGHVAIAVYEITEHDTMPKQRPAESPMPGFDLADCDPIQGDNLAHPVTWKGKDLGELQGKKVFFEYRMENCELYSFGVSPQNRR